MAAHTTKAIVELARQNGAGARPTAPLVRLFFFLSRLVDFSHAAVNIGSDDLRQLLDLVLEEVVGTSDDGMLNLDTLLYLGLGCELGDRVGGNDTILIAINQQPRCWAGGEKGVVIKIGRRGNTYEAGDLGPTH